MPTSTSEWIPVFDDGCLADGGYAVAFPRGLGVLIARVDGALYAVANRCPHMGCPLEGGTLKGAVLTCPCHDWRFDVRDGHFITAPELGLRTFSTQVDDGVISVRLEEEHG